MKEIWVLQPRFEQRSGVRPFRMLENARFRAAYDFLLLRGESGEVDLELGEWWTEFQDASETGRAEMLQPANATNAPKKRRRRTKKLPPTDVTADSTSA
jgi:poly(A) polymerase